MVDRDSLVRAQTARRWRERVERVEAELAALRQEADQLHAAIARVRAEHAAIHAEMDDYARTHNPDCNCDVIPATRETADRMLAALDGQATSEPDESTRALNFLDHLPEDAMTRHMVDARRALGETATFDQVAVEAARRARAADQTGDADATP